eukprot:512341-Pelagomonas_calceolata.AAC.3
MPDSAPAGQQQHGSRCGKAQPCCNQPQPCTETGPAGSGSCGTWLPAPCSPAGRSPAPTMHDH